MAFHEQWPEAQRHWETRSRGNSNHPNGFGTDGPRAWLLQLQGVAYRQLVPEGTAILTSGLGGVLPRGIPIGTVVGAAGEAEGWERTYLVRPAVHPAAVTHVMILTGPPLKGDLRSVFQSGGEAPP